MTVALAVDLDVASSPATWKFFAREAAYEQRAEAALDRLQSESDRTHAAKDREQAAHDRNAF